MTNEQLEQLLSQHKEELEKKDNRLMELQGEYHDFCEWLKERLEKQHGLEQQFPMKIEYTARVNQLVEVINELKERQLWT